MRSQVVKFILTPVIVDVDDAGDPVFEVPAEIVPHIEFMGRHAIEKQLRPKLRELDDLLAQRTASLNAAAAAAAPNRAARRSNPKKGRG